jgi:hypothetical protein
MSTRHSHSYGGIAVHALAQSGTQGDQRRSDQHSDECGSILFDVTTPLDFMVYALYWLLAGLIMTYRYYRSDQYHLEY